VEIVTERYTSDTRRVTRAELIAWVTRAQLRVTSLIDASPGGFETNARLGVMDTTLLVEMPSMRVLWRARNGGPRDIQTAAAELERRAAGR
jgi:hypothetical protein